MKEKDLYQEIDRQSDPFDEFSFLEGTEDSARLPSDYSQHSLAVEGAEKYYSIQTFDVQLTVRSRVELTRKYLCMLSGLSLRLVADKGISLSDWIILEYLYSNLLGNKLEPYERKDPKEFELSLLLKITLLSGTWMGLNGRKQLPEDIRSLIESSKWVPNQRTLSSWLQSYRLNKFLEIRAVPLNVLLERSKNTIPYSSYCKGYGESSHLGRRQKLRPSAELDGEPVDVERDQVVKLDLLDIGRVLRLALAEIKYTQKNK